MLLRTPGDVICGSIFPLLSVRDLQSLDTAYTNKDLRPHLRRLWTLYNYDNIDCNISFSNICWLYCTGVKLLSVSLGREDKEIDFDSVPFTDITTITRLNIDSYAFFFCDDEDYDYFLSNVVKIFPQLEVLRIDFDDYSDDVIASVAPHCHELHTISWANNDIAHTSIQALCDNCPHLQNIDCWDLSDASLISIASTYSHLQSITINGDYITDAGVLAIADKCHELRSVTIEGCSNITSHGLTALWAANPNLTNVYCSCNMLSDDVMLKLSQCCPDLQILHHWKCRNITSSAVIAVAEHCPQLTSLCIESCYNISDTALITLGQHCHGLKSINISFIENISDVGISAFAIGCPLLRQFEAFFTNITDAGVIALARNCHDLRKINMSGCQLIGLDAISAIAENCPLISEVSLQKCRFVDDACLCVIAEHCRNLTLLDVRKTKVSDMTPINKSSRKINKSYYL